MARRVKNVFVDGDNNQMRLILDMEGGSAVIIDRISRPSPGKCKVTNIYVDPNTHKLVVEYEDTPVGG